MSGACLPNRCCHLSAPCLPLGPSVAKAAQSIAICESCKAVIAIPWVFYRVGLCCVHWSRNRNSVFDVPFVSAVCIRMQARGLDPLASGAMEWANLTCNIGRHIMKNRKYVNMWRL